MGAASSFGEDTCRLGTPSAVGDSAAGQGEPGAAWEGGGHVSPSLGAPA